MSPDIQDLIDGYFDGSLSSKELQRLSHWIKSDVLHARQFASDLMLHDRLRNQFKIQEELVNQECYELSVVSLSKIHANSWVRWPVTWTTTACLVFLGAFLLWHSLGTSSASAAVTELNRIIEANRHSLDRRFLLSVEKTVVPEGERERKSPEHGRPAKPSLDNAILDVRGSNEFVLKRIVDPGEFFITGSNGVTSWAVRPDGPVRYSDDLTRFNRDLPGHERSLPINNLQDGLDALHKAYDLKVLPVESSESDIEPDAESNRRMVAVKKPGFLGPVQIEIMYNDSTGQIRQMRFVDMPYGPENVSLKMTLIDERTLPVNYFDHQSHHDPKRIVEFE
ncbi:hypothetical protein Pla110_42530 [Polystyrenella longa]|uniref:Uncharacterized protein n=1 Tax=Polystyrenella longa TaxID=2528007 RepID=A0A518CTF7_9PLAN|nr:hypothetical protein [Polystyrenella longa]QDU82495.1 hypothetical protein Pla110_42530 [Polystyrenella longa]